MSLPQGRPAEGARTGHLLAPILLGDTWCQSLHITNTTPGVLYRFRAKNFK